MGEHRSKRLHRAVIGIGVPGLVAIVGGTAEAVPGHFRGGSAVHSVASDVQTSFLSDEDWNSTGSRPGPGHGHTVGGGRARVRALPASRMF